MTVRPLRLIVRHLRHLAWPSPFLLLLTVTAGLTAVFAPSQAVGQALRAEPPRLTQLQKRIISKIEKSLQTKFKSKENPADKNTWYVLVFIETAMGARESSEVSGNTLTIWQELQAARNSAAKITQGRKEAALLLLQYYIVPNSAAVRLRPTAGGSTDRANAAAAKRWVYWAFETEDEAQELYERISPEKKRR